MVAYKKAADGGGGTVCRSFCKHDRSHTFSLHRAEEKSWLALYTNLKGKH